MRQLARPDCTVFDVGANIGLMAAPVLQANPRCRVVSFEPSPNALPWLSRTIAQSAYAKRWELIPKAIGKEVGMVNFSVGAARMGMLDGMRSTGRTKEVSVPQVPVTTLDREWETLGRPTISLIKVDVEGAELLVLEGGEQVVRTCRPFILSEWHKTNLEAYKCEPQQLLAFAREREYDIYTVPAMVRVIDASDLQVQMLGTETFLLAPQDTEE